jgi:hypothetical protein
MSVGAHVRSQARQLAEGGGRGQSGRPRNSARDDHTAAEAVAAQPGAKAHDTFFVPAQAGVGHGLAGGFGVPEHGIKVVGDALQFGM